VFECELIAFTPFAFSSFCAPWLYFSDVLSINLREKSFFNNICFLYKRFFCFWLNGTFHLFHIQAVRIVRFGTFLFEKAFMWFVHQAFSDYQLQQMTSNFIDQFGFNEEEFAEQEEKIEWVTFFPLWLPGFGLTLEFTLDDSFLWNVWRKKWHV